MKLSSKQITVNQYKNASRYTLMHKDIPLIDIDEENSIFDIHTNNQELLPYALKKTNLSYRNFEAWAGRRVLPLDRKNAKLLLNACNLPQDDKFGTAKACKLLSIEDCFWIKESDSESWENINLKNNSLSNAISQIALNGESITITGDIQTPEFTTVGSFPKTWIREPDGLYLHKKSSGSFESEKEVLVSDILNAMDIPHVSYEMTGSGICRCRCMTDGTYSRLSFGEYKIYCENNHTDPLEIFNTRFNREFFQMAVIDYMIANPDRHSGNWGFFVDNSTGEITAVHPLFDHNLAFDTMLQDNTRYTPASQFGYYELAQSGMGEYKFDLSGFYEIPEERFTELGIEYETVMKRVNKLKRLSRPFPNIDSDNSYEHNGIEGME